MQLPDESGSWDLVSRVAGVITPITIVAVLIREFPKIGDPNIVP